tara:strand:- start:5050 stop:5682 length:633 start_codon:yes stop_codon:yes gene_type:complete
MAFVLKTSQFAQGLESYSALCLQSLRQLATVSPFTITAAKTALDSGQPQTFSTEGFKQFLSVLYNLEIDQASLTAAEITVLNVIREYINPAPQSNCCGTDTPVIGLMTKVFNDRIGSSTFEKEARLELSSTVSCDVFTIDLAFTPGGGAPALAVSPVTLTSLGCIGGKSVYSKLWIDFASSPSGHAYDLLYTFKDSSGTTITTVSTTHTF